MLQLVLLAAAPLVAPAAAPADVPNAVPFAWARAERVRVTVDLDGDGPAGGYAYDLAVAPEDGGGVRVSRAGFELLPGETPPPQAPEPDPGPDPEGPGRAASPFSGARAQLAERRLGGELDLDRGRLVPDLRAAPDGGFVEFVEVGAALDRLAAAMAARGELPPGARVRMGAPLYVDAWLCGPRREWDQFTSAWVGLSLEPGERDVAGRIFLDTSALESLERTLRVTVGEPFEQDGRRVVRVERAARVTDEELGSLRDAYLAGMGARPSDPKVLGNVEGLHTEQLLLDVATGLPVEIRTTGVVHLGMRGARRTWRETAVQERRYRFDWKLR